MPFNLTNFILFAIIQLILIVGVFIWFHFELKYLKKKVSNVYVNPNHTCAIDSRNNNNDELILRIEMAEAEIFSLQKRFENIDNNFSSKKKHKLKKKKKEKELGNDFNEDIDEILLDN